MEGMGRRLAEGIMGRRSAGNGEEEVTVGGGQKESPGGQQNT